MNAEDRVMTIEELSDLVGVPVRTIRYYISEGLLPGPGARGKGASYSQEHLLRLQLIRVLVDRRVPLAEIRQQLAGLPTGEIGALLAEESRRTAAREQAARSESPRDYISALLDRARGDRSTTRLSREAPSNPRLDAFAQSAPGDRSAAGSLMQPGSTWERLELAPGVELHVRSDARQRHRRLIDQLLRIARMIWDRWTE